MERAEMLSMLEFSMIHADSRRAALEPWLAAQLRGARFSLAPASVDASFRRYFRATLPDGRSYVVMDAPPDKEDCRPFVHVARLLRAAGVHAPEVHAEDLARGFLLLGDLGTQTYLQELNADNAARLLGDATDALLRWQLATRPGELPPYDEALLRREMNLFPEWYVARHRRKDLTAQQSQTLQTLLNLKTSITLSTTASSVIAGSASPEFRTITIDKGTGDALRPDMALIAPAAGVGRVILQGSRASKVQLLIDRNAAAGAIVERTRAQGVVVGTGADRLRMDYVSGAADVKAGDMVVTSGIDGIYPKGFVIGQIESVRRGAGEFSAIVIRPAVDFSALEAVLIILTPPAAGAEPVAVTGSNQDRE